MGSDASEMFNWAPLVRVHPSSGRARPQLPAHLSSLSEASITADLHFETHPFDWTRPTPNPQEE
jgi:hypothetical protein